MSYHKRWYNIYYTKDEAWFNSGYKEYIRKIQKNIQEKYKNMYFSEKYLYMEKCLWVTPSLQFILWKCHIQINTICFYCIHTFLPYSPTSCATNVLNIMHSLFFCFYYTEFYLCCSQVSPLKHEKLTMVTSQGKVIHPPQSSHYFNQI